MSRGAQGNSRLAPHKHLARFFFDSWLRFTGNKNNLKYA